MKTRGLTAIGAVMAGATLLYVITAYAQRPPNPYPVGPVGDRFVAPSPCGGGPFAAATCQTPAPTKAVTCPAAACPSGTCVGAVCTAAHANSPSICTPTTCPAAAAHQANCSVRSAGVHPAHPGALPRFAGANPPACANGACAGDAFAPGVVVSASAAACPDSTAHARPDGEISAAARLFTPVQLTLVNMAVENARLKARLEAYDSAMNFAEEHAEALGEIARLQSSLEAAEAQMEMFEGLAEMAANTAAMETRLELLEEFHEERNELIEQIVASMTAQAVAEATSGLAAEKSALERRVIELEREVSDLIAAREAAVARVATEPSQESVEKAPASEVR